MNENIQYILQKEAEAIQQIPASNQYEKAIALIYEQVHVKHGKVVTSGIGKAGQVAQNLASTLSSTGTPAVYLHPSEAQHGDLGLVHKEDVFILISNSGKTRELLELCILSHNLHGKQARIVISGNAESPLAKQGDVVLETGAPEEVCPMDLTPTTSITCMHVIGHVLTVLLINKTEFTKDGFLKRHHGGYLGSILKTMDLS